MGYTDQDKAIFKYTDPVTGQDRYGDPMVIDRALLLGTKGHLDEWLTQASSEDPVQRALAIQDLLPAIRQAFSLPPINLETGEGVPDAPCILICNEFNAWRDAFFLATASGPKLSPSSAVPNPMPNTTDSPCTGCG